MSDKKICCICGRYTEENAAVLAYGGYGTPRLLCKECEWELDVITVDKTPENIKAAMNSLGEKMTRSDPDDLTIKTLNILIYEAADRAEQIEKGTYDFSAEEEENKDEGFDEIPEELLETEEDKALDEADEKKQKKFDKIFNIITAALIIAAVGFLAYKLISGLL